MPEWKKANNVVVSTAKFVKDNIDKDMPQVLIDLRPADEAKKGVIPGAFSVPASEVSTAKDRFPADKKAPIVLYSSDAESAMAAFRIVRGWGFANTSFLDGGVEAWTKAGNSLVPGELKTTIVYVPKPRPGEITIEEFKKIAETLPPDKLILDIREEDEAMDGMLRGAKNIPTQNISTRFAEIPKDREIITYCITGVRAEMAYNILKEAGYKTRFLNANIAIDKDGKYEITKE